MVREHFHAVRRSELKDRAISKAWGPQSSPVSSPLPSNFDQSFPTLDASVAAAVTYYNGKTSKCGPMRTPASILSVEPMKSSCSKAWHDSS